MSMVRWQPFNNLARMSARGLFDDLFNTMLDADGNEGSAWYPRVDVRDNKDTIEVHAELPGMSKDDIKVTYENNYLTISGERKLEDKKEDTNYYRVERQYGRFSRSFRLPVEVHHDIFQANYTTGLLHLSQPKVEAKKPREISINVN